MSESSEVQGVVSEVEPEISSVVERLHTGALRAADLSAELRQQCVQHLTLAGFSASEIAQLMRMGVRTVTRDRAAIRRQQAITPDEHLGDELLGEFQQITLASIQRLTRLSTDSSVQPFARPWAEGQISMNYKRFMDVVHRMEYLETGRARLDHRKAMDPAAQQVELKRMKAALQKSRALAQLYLDTNNP